MWYVPGYVPKEMKDLRTRATSGLTKVWTSTIQQINRKQDDEIRTSFLRAPVTCESGKMSWTSGHKDAFAKFSFKRVPFTNTYTIKTSECGGRYLSLLRKCSGEYMLVD